MTRFRKQPSTHCTSQADFMKRRRVLLNLLIQPFLLAPCAATSAAAVPSSAATSSQQLPHRSPASQSSLPTHFPPVLTPTCVLDCAFCVSPGCPPCMHTQPRIHERSSLISMPGNTPMFYFPNPYSERTFCFRCSGKVANMLAL